MGLFTISISMISTTYIVPILFLIHYYLSLVFIPEMKMFRSKPNTDDIHTYVSNVVHVDCSLSMIGLPRDIIVILTVSVNFQSGTLQVGVNSTFSFFDMIFFSLCTEVIYYYQQQKAYDSDLLTSVIILLPSLL